LPPLLERFNNAPHRSTVGLGPARSDPDVVQQELSP
jgi:hypothetical protein